MYYIDRKTKEISWSNKILRAFWFHVGRQDIISLQII